MLLGNAGQLWHYPPQPALNQIQLRHFLYSFAVDAIQAKRVKVLCPNPASGQHQLTGGGLHKRARQVLDINKMYNLESDCPATSESG
ncbi:hypothetical protein QQF64_035720 [Cirrhinus molitorella]|uniref:DUF6729 domain-containing protein n=1 Tax=Cirrhinus molitorella TaxID=172907 RepID=A0ABR3NGV4_9TELE